MTGRQDRQTFVMGLQRALDRLKSSGDAHDEREVWYLTAEVLTALYRLEEFQRHSDSAAYYEHRNTDPDGRVLAALIWFRGAVDHEGHDVREPLLEPGRLLLEDGGLLLTEDGDAILIDTVVGWVWPNHPAGRPDARHGRDGFYADHVAGRPVIETIERAATYLLGRP